MSREYSEVFCAWKYALRMFIWTLLCAIAQFGHVSAQESAAQSDTNARNAWRYSIPGGAAYFRKLDGTFWLENTATSQLHFQEVARRNQYVELFDASRNMRLRLHANYAEWRLDDQSQWKRLHVGRWVAASDLPVAAAADYRIRLVYFVPADRTPTQEYEKKIRVLMHFVSELYRQDFVARGIKSDGLRFEGVEGLATVHLVRGAKTAAFYNGAPNYDREVLNHKIRVFDEIPSKIGIPARNLMVVFAETYDDEPHRIEWPGGIALGARRSAEGGTAIFSAWILRDEFTATTVERQKQLLFDTNPIKGRTALGHGMPNSPRFEFIEDGFGAVAHEIGHALGLPHDRRDDQVYIMGNGFRNLRWNFMPDSDPKRRVRFSNDNARILYSSRYLARDAVLSDRIPPSIRLNWVGPLRSGATSIAISVAATDNEGLRAILYFSPSQGSVVGGRDLMGKQQNFQERIPVSPLKRGPFHVRALVADRGGNHSQVELEGVVEE